jgi:aminopeptidase YwaD
MLRVQQVFSNLQKNLHSEKDILKRSIVFIAFSGEELGLLGSSYFVNNTPVPVSDMTTMINMDMIGRLNENSELIVYGTGTSAGWKDLLNNL